MSEPMAGPAENSVSTIIRCPPRPDLCQSKGIGAAGSVLVLAVTTVAVVLILAFVVMAWIHRRSSHAADRKALGRR
jgi:hypothetical protein